MNKDVASSASKRPTATPNILHSPRLKVLKQLLARTTTTARLAVERTDAVVSAITERMSRLVAPAV